MRYPNRITLRDAQRANQTQTEINGYWYPARPEGYASFGSRIRLAWAVFTGKADALFWPHDSNAMSLEGE